MGGGDYINTKPTEIREPILLFYILLQNLSTMADTKVCDSCQNSLASFSTLLISWSITNDWNDEEIKDDGDSAKSIMEIKCKMGHSVEIDEMSFSESVSAGTGFFKKDETDNDVDQEMTYIYLKNEEVDIKPDDEER